MTLFEYINLNIPSLKIAIRSGLVNTSILREWEIYCRYDYYKKAGEKNALAIFFTSEDFRVKECWVYRIVKKMKSEI